MTDPKMRLVRKDWPVFGDASAYAAYCSFAAAREGKYASVHDALIGSKQDLDSKEDVQQVLRNAGFASSGSTRTSPFKSQNTQPSWREMNAGPRIGLRGTPGLIVGDQRVPGGLDYAELARLLARARQGAAH
jgi:protein-disulfide isomerase